MIDDAIKERVKHPALRERIVSPGEAAKLVKNAMRIGTSGSLSSGYPIAFFKALSERSRSSDAFKIDVWSAAPIVPEVDGNLVEAGMVQRRLCHQANPIMAKMINKGEISYTDMGPYAFANQVRYGFFGDLDLAVIEAVQITEEGNIVPSTCVADSPSLVQAAKTVIVEINEHLPLEMAGMHDIVIPENAPNRQPLLINTPADRVGTAFIPVDPLKIAGIIISSEPMRSIPEEGTTEESDQIAHHLITFFENEVSKGKMPAALFPLQTGLGSLGKAILKRLGESNFEGLQTFSALLSDAVLDLIDLGKMSFVSGTGLYFSSEGFNRFYKNIEEYKKMIILRPVDISAHPELIQRLGVIALNGAVEVDIYGHINSSHIGGGRVITGVAGSIEYARNGALSVFMTPSIGKRCDISRIVPMVAHVDHTEHDVHVIVTEQGVADIRGLDPRERAVKIINHCAHPDYRPLLMEYFERAKSEVGGHEPQMLDEAFIFHKRLKETGSMKI
jgi:succinyl-CoA:acetate CoA-transferase